MENKITLFLMTLKGYKVLEAISKEFRELIDFVVVARDKNVQDDYYDEIRDLCKNLGISCLDRRDNYEISSQYAIAISWRWMINLGETQLIVFHDSLLPKYRGFNPLVSYLINGETMIGVTALFASEEYDRGDIIEQAASKITYPLKIAEAIEIVSANYAEVAQVIANKIGSGNSIVGKSQNEDEASYSLWRDDEDYRMDWLLSASEIRRFVDAVGFPYKGALTFIRDRSARIFAVKEYGDVFVENRQPGKVIFINESFPVVVCGQGLLKITSLIDDETRENLLPLASFRTRFK